MEIDKKLVGDRIKRRRKAAGLTQEALAEQIELSKNHLSNIERGRYLPTIETLLMICDALGQTPDYYLIGKIFSGNRPYLPDGKALIRGFPTDIVQIDRDLSGRKLHSELICFGCFCKNKEKSRKNADIFGLRIFDVLLVK